MTWLRLFLPCLLVAGAGAISFAVLTRRDRRRELAALEQTIQEAALERAKSEVASGEYDMQG